MKTRLLDLLEDARASFWALPMLCLLLAIALAVGNRLLETRFADALPDELFGLLDLSATDSNQAILSTTATAVLGTLGIVFSVTITTLVLASQQYGPHLIRTYMQKSFVQGVLGFFAGSGLYCLLALQLTGASEGAEVLPVITMLTVPFLVVANLALLIIFIHRTARSLQADEVIAQAHADFLERADELLGGRGPSPASRPPAERLTLHRVDMLRSGYLQAIDCEALIELAREHDTLIDIPSEVSAYLLAGNVLARVQGVGADEDEGDAPDARAMASIERRIRASIVIGSSPTPTQDRCYALRQLNQIGLRALSAAINDPVTAMSCLDRMSSIVGKTLSHSEPSSWHTDAEGIPRLTVRVIEHDRVVAYAFDSIRMAGAEQPNVLIHLLRCLEALAEQRQLVPYLAALERQREAVIAHARCLDLAEADRVPLERAIARSACLRTKEHEGSVHTAA